MDKVKAFPQVNFVLCGTKAVSCLFLCVRAVLFLDSSEVLVFSW